MRIIIVGKGGSGKDTLLNRFVEKGAIKSISYTTRPPREGEKDGIDYYFVSLEKFKEMEINKEFHETDCFNSWWYGTTLLSWENIGNVFIKTPRGVLQISEQDIKNCFVIYLDIDIRTRINRLRSRNDADKVQRRLAADERDFKNFKDFDMRINNPFF